MAKKSMIARELKRAKLVAKQAEKRKALKAIIRNVNSTDDERAVAQAKLNKLPRDGSPTRQRNRCAITETKDEYDRSDRRYADSHS